VRTLVSKAIGERLRRLRGSLSQVEFSKVLGIAQQQYSRYESGKRIAPDEVLRKAADFAHVDVSQIVAPAARSVPFSAEVRIVAPEEAKERLEGLERAENYVPIPLVSDRAAAGDPRYINENDVEGYAVIYQSWLTESGSYSCVRIQGESMMPVLGEGDIVCVNHARRDPMQLRGKIVAASLGDEGVTIKYLNWDERSWVLEPENRAFRPIYVPKERDVVVGAVEWCWRRFR
jgi:SOS-response transcriptional repressor LexA